MTPQNELWEAIKPLASKYESLSTSDKIKLLAFIKKDIEQEREKLVLDLRNLDDALGHQATIELPPTKTSTRRGRIKGSMSTGDAIITTLKNGDVMDKGSIREGVIKLKGGKVSEASITGTLMQLTKKKAIKNVSRGKYSLA